jgi:hypothetical protein
MAFRDLMLNNQELNRVATGGPVEPLLSTQLLEVLTATLISGSTFRYLYTVQTARVGNAPTYTPAAEGADIMNALSVSELSNVANGPIAYGTDIDNLPTGFAPVNIPTGTYVLGVPHNLADGTFIWLIVNTQAVDGTCT